MTVKPALTDSARAALMAPEPPVFIALSGGVDSAVAAMLLKQEGHNLIGISHIVWPESRCCTSACLDRSRLQCQAMGIPYISVDCIVEFCKRVIVPFCDKYYAGQTPNPCVWCNAKVRFSEMISAVFQAYPELERDDWQIATGHYARVAKTDTDIHLYRSRAQGKDQAYMLSQLKVSQLARCRFPLGGYQKEAVREMACSWQLSSAKAPDSQDACFVSGHYADFIQEFTDRRAVPGEFITQDGKVLGQHPGTIYFTRGQRRGLGLSDGPWYVLQPQPDTGYVVLGRHDDLAVTEFQVEDINWLVPMTEIPRECTVQTRYHSPDAACQLSLTSADAALIELDKPSYDVCPGQIAVFYQEDLLIGSGVIVQSLEECPRFHAGLR